MERENSDKSEDDTEVVLFSALLDSAEDLILATDAKLRLVYVNRSLQDATGIPIELLLGQTVIESGLFGRHAADLHTGLKKAARTARPGQFEIDWAREGTPRFYRFLIQVDLDGDRVRHVIAQARDVSEQRRIENDLREREREFRTLAENSPDNIIRYGLDKCAIYCNREIEERVLDVSAECITGHTPSEAAPTGMRGIEAYEAQLSHTLATGESGVVELVVPHPDGNPRVHSVVITAEYDADGAVCGALAVGRDVTEQVEARQALQAKEREFRTLAENAGDNIVRWNTKGRILYANPALARLFGTTLEGRMESESTDQTGQSPEVTSREVMSHMEKVAQAVQQVAQEGSEVMMELRLKAPGMRHSEVHQIRLVPERDQTGKVCSVLGFGRDISEKLEHLELIESLVHTDPLTRLANRQALQERAPDMFRAAKQHHTYVAVMLLDLDEFKSVNDGMGHSAGDKMLREVARRLSGCLRSNDLLVRLGGDEFVIVAPDVENIENVGMIVSRLHTELAAPHRIGQRELHSTASIGVALYPKDGEHLEQLLAHADTAMYQAKRAGRARTEYYRNELGDAVRHRMALEDAMHDACNGAGLELYFQPQFDLLEPHRVVGAEALLRWRHPTLGFLTPDKFIALAEKSGAIVPMGRWVMRTAAETAVRWNRNRSQPLHISVNVSTRQFIDDNLPALLEEVLAQTGCKPSWLWIEITESALLQDSPRVQQTLEAFHRQGVRIALDDFGTGYSALNYLARFPVDCLKIDRSFVHGIGHGHRNDELVKAFIAMATALNLTTVAEGVETARQTTFLLEQKCNVVQGFLFGHPLPGERFAAEVLTRAFHPIARKSK